MIAANRCIIWTVKRTVTVIKERFGGVTGRLVSYQDNCWNDHLICSLTFSFKRLHYKIVLIGPTMLCLVVVLCLLCLQVDGFIPKPTTMSKPTTRPTRASFVRSSRTAKSR